MQLSLVNPSLLLLMSLSCFSCYFSYHQNTLGRNIDISTRKEKLTNLKLGTLEFHLLFQPILRRIFGSSDVLDALVIIFIWGDWNLSSVLMINHLFFSFFFFFFSPCSFKMNAYQGLHSHSLVWLFISYKGLNCNHLSMSKSTFTHIS